MTKAHDNAPSGGQGDLFAQERNLPTVANMLWEKLARSRFRSKFHLSQDEIAYLERTGLPQVLDHGAAFIARKLAPARPENDGRQTPWRGHPVFVAQHATATCCRSCLMKWHGFEKNTALVPEQQNYVLAVIAGWLEREIDRSTSGRTGSR